VVIGEEVVAMRVAMMGMSGSGEPAVTVDSVPGLGRALPEGTDSYPIANAGMWRDVVAMEALFTQSGVPAPRTRRRGK
jgi:hypothetical protein